ncbi:hypothetical protein [Tropicimonas sp. IMCC6043]|uniref:hypothetical protein n=1 Tax=Tropicimonas sp. IMCC6043 TaxID=2510645 RepID=UPI00101DB15D|nr:hypothetical protein [Tropicimonas sp. IMCC6043]RYH11238.1 hypothetical protein EU800_05090 [Tropicimonas sp. IMCC6043]
MAETSESETPGGTVLVIGSGPGAVAARDWLDPPFDAVVAINNAWAVRPDWTHHIHPEDFPPERGPAGCRPGQRVVTYEEYVPANNAFGGVLYAGGTMAFTAGYWALHRLQPRVIAFVGCDMVYPSSGPTHFYGTGTADPLRPDLSLRSLEAKAARLALKAAQAGCACVNLSPSESRLVFPRATLPELATARVSAPDLPAGITEAAEQLERDAGYVVASGRYWEAETRFDPARIDAIDAAWSAAYARLRE